MLRFGRIWVIPASLIAASIVAGCGAEPNTGNVRVGTLQYVSGNNQTGSAGLLLSQHLVVRLVDQYDRPVAGEIIQFLPDTASALLGASPEPAADTTGSDGIASTQFRLGTGAGEYRVSAVWRLRPLHAITFTATATAAPPAGLAIVSGNNQTAGAGSLLPQPLTVRVTDAFTNPIPGVSVTFAVTGGGGQVGATNVVTNALGIASTSWTLGPILGAQSVTVLVSGVTPVTFNATAN